MRTPIAILVKPASLSEIVAAVEGSGTRLANIIFLSTVVLSVAT